MPVDEEMSGRLRDNIATIVESGGARLRVMDQDSALSNLVTDSKIIFKEIADEQLDHKLANKHIMEDLLDEIEESFISWGLSENQEHTLIDIVQRSITRSMELYDKGRETDKKMTQIFERLSKLA